MKSVILLQRRRVLWGTVMTACLLSGSILTTRSANLLWRSAAVRVAQGFPFPRADYSRVSKQRSAPRRDGAQSNPAASPNPESRIPNPVYGSAAQPRLAEAYGKLPLSFEVNKGQTDSRVKFLSRGSGYSLFLTGNEAVLSLRKSNSNGKRQMAKGVAQGFPRPRRDGAHSNPAVLPGLFAGPEAHENGAAFPAYFKAPTAEFSDSAPANDCGGKDLEKPQGLKGEPCATQATEGVLRMKLVGANPRAKVSGLDELPGKSNYFIGNDPKKWRTNVPNYAKVKYANVYPGVDLVYYGNQGQLEYDFVVSPGADPNSIQLAINSGEQVGSRQKAVGRTAQPQDPEPEGQSAIDNRKSSIAAPLHVNATGDLVVGTDYGEVIFHKPVVYQPALASAAGLSLVTRHSSLVEGRYRLDVDNRIHFELGRYDRRRPVVIDPVLAYSTYLGGSGGDAGNGIAVDAAGNAYVTGFTTSSDFPTTPGAFQTTSGGSYDAFVSKLNAAGSALLYSTYLGGSRNDNGLGIAVDSSGNVYVTGFTGSSDFPTTPSAFQRRIHSGWDGFVTKLNVVGSGLLYSTYLGGGRYDQGNAIAVDASGSAYVTGTTASSDFPTTPGAFQTRYRGHGSGCCSIGDAFVSKLNADGSALLYSTYLGGSANDSASGIGLDASANAYVTGYTDSSNFPTTPGAFQTTYGGNGDAFVTKLNAAGSALVYSTYLGGNSLGNGIAVDTSDSAYVAGTTSSPNFPTTPGAFQTTCGGSQNGFVSKLDGAGSALVYSTYLCGELGLGIAVDASGSAYLILGVGSVSKLNAAGSALVYSFGLGGGSGIAIDASGNTYVTGYPYYSDFPITPGAFQTTYGGYDAFVAKISPADAPGLALAPAKLIFGPQAVGTTSAPLSVTLLDAGSQPLSITSIVASGDFAQTNDCGSSVPNGTPCTFSVTFTPRASGTRAGAVTIRDNAAGSPHELPLTGKGVVAPVTLTPASVAFLVLRTVGTTSLPQTVKLINVGSAQLDITGITLTGPDPQDFAQTNSCPPTVAPGASCVITVTFTPTAQGVRTASVSITDTAIGSPQTVSLSGRATFFEWSPRSLNMGDQKVGTSSAARTVKLTNAGTAPIAIFSIGIGGVNTGDFTETHTCGTSLKAGASCFIQVTFTPTAVGSRLGHVAIRDNAFGGTHWVGLLGKGT
jgi:hypothetical protein